MVSICWLGISSSDQELENLTTEQMFDRGVNSEITPTLLYLIYQHCFPIKVIRFTNSAFFKHSYHFWDACSRLFADMLPRIAVVAYNTSVLEPILWPVAHI
jgi:hypothetical protein